MSVSIAQQQPCIMNPELSQPLRVYMLSSLPASLITALRQSCRHFQELIDKQAGPVWDSLARKYLSGAICAACPSDIDGTAVRKALLHQAAVLAQLRAIPFQAESICIQPSVPMPTATSPSDSARHISWLWDDNCASRFLYVIKVRPHACHLADVQDVVWQACTRAGVPSYLSIQHAGIS